MKEIKLGTMYGYEMVVKDVPDEVFEQVSKYCKEHIEEMNKVYVDHICPNLEFK